MMSSLPTLHAWLSCVVVNSGWGFKGLKQCLSSGRSKSSTLNVFPLSPMPIAIALDNTLLLVFTHTHCQTYCLVLTAAQGASSIPPRPHDPSCSANSAAPQPQSSWQGSPTCSPLLRSFPIWVTPWPWPPTLPWGRLPPLP